MIAGYPIASAPIASIHPGTVWDFSTRINSYTNSSLYGRLVTKAVKSSVASSIFLSTERLVARSLSSFNVTSANNNLCRVINRPSIILFSDSQLLTSVKTILVGNSLIKSNSCSNLFARLLTNSISVLNSNSNINCSIRLLSRALSNNLSYSEFLSNNVVITSLNFLSSIDSNNNFVCKKIVRSSNVFSSNLTTLLFGRSVLAGEISVESNFQPGFYSRLIVNCASLFNSSLLNDYNVRGIYNAISRYNSLSTSEFSLVRVLNGSLILNSYSCLNNNMSGIFCGRINTIDFSNFTSTVKLISRIQNNNRTNSSLSSLANKTTSIISNFINKSELNSLSSIIYNGNLNVQNHSLLNSRMGLIIDINLINKIYSDLLLSGTVLIGPKMRVLQDSAIANLLTNNLIINAIQNKLILFSDILTIDSVLSSRITNNLILEDIVGS